MDEAFERAEINYYTQREKIAGGYNKALNFEIENTHLDRGLPGGQGSLNFTHKQKIVNHWTKPMKHAWRADHKFAKQYEVYNKETTLARVAAYEQAIKKMPPIFKKIETSWTALADDFNSAEAL